MARTERKARYRRAVPEPTKKAKTTKRAKTSPAKASPSKKAAAKATPTKPSKASRRATATKPAKAAATLKPGAFGPPDWRNVSPPPIEVIPTGDAKIDAALAAVFSGEADAKAEQLAAKASDEQLIAMFAGNALLPGRPFHDEALVAALTPGEKRARNKAYWAAESQKNGRERVFAWFCRRLATSPAGRARLLDVAAGDHAGRVRAMAAHALRDSNPDASLWQQIGARLDPANFLGEMTRETSTYLLHTYTVGAMGGLVTDASAAYRRWTPLLEVATAAKSERSRTQASAIVLGIRDYIGEVLADEHAEEGQGHPARDPAPCVPFIPYLLALLDNRHFEHFAMFALERLPDDPQVTAKIAAKMGPHDKATYFGRTEVALLARSSDPTYLPWLAAALGNSWMHWPPVFEGLARMGDPRGIAIIEAWMADNDASDRRGPAKRAIDAIRSRSGDPTATQRAEGVALLGAGDKKKKKRR